MAPRTKHEMLRRRSSSYGVALLGACAILSMISCTGSTPAPLLPPANSGVEAPEAVPHDVKPRLVNAGEVKALLLDSYPPRLREEGISGLVVMFIFIDRHGRVTQVRPRTASPRPQFNKAAESVVRGMRFEPAEADGQPVGIWTIQEVSFATH